MKNIVMHVCLPVCLLMALFSVEVSADVRGKVTESNGSGIPEAVVSLFNKADSTMVATGMTDASGDFLIRSGKGSFILRVERIGFAAKSLETDGDESLNIPLEPDATTLDEAVVTAYKPGTVKREAGKYVVVPKLLPVEAMVGLDVLKTLPLVEVKDNDKIDMAGKTNTIIYINGKLPIEPQEAVIASLRSMPPDNIKYVELITDPGAEYHNPSSVGIINVVVRNPNEGLVGNIRSYNNIASYLFDTNDNLWLGYQKGKLHLGANFSYGYLNYHDHDSNEYNYKEFGYSTFNDTKDRYHGTSLSGSLSANYQLTGNSELAASVRMAGNTNRNDIYTVTTDSRNEGIKDMFASKRHKPFGRPYVSSALRYTLTTDSRGSNIELKGVYSNFRNKQDMDYYYNGEYASSDLTDSKSEYVYAYAKYYYKPSFVGSFNFGYEYTHTDYDVYNNLDDVADRFLYRRNNHDLYAKYGAGLTSWLYLSAGLRAEYSHSNGEQKADGSRFRRNDWIIQPDVNLSFTLPRASQSISLSYMNSGLLPWIAKMNPFRRWTSDNSYTVGNPYLEVNKMRSYSLGYSLLDRIYLNATYLYCPEGNMDYTYFDEEGNTVTSTSPGSKTKNAYLTLSYNDTFANFIRLKASAYAYYNNEKKLLNDNWLANHSWNWKADASVKFIIKPWNSSIEVFGYYSDGYKGVVQSTNSSYSVSVNMSKVFGNSFRIDFSINNLIKNKDDRYNNTPYYSFYSHDFNTHRIYSVSLLYVFGNRKARGAYDESGNSLDSMK